VRRSPLRVAIYTFVVVVVVGFAVFLTAMAIKNPRGPEGDAAAERFGTGLGTFAPVCAVVAYFLQRRRVGKP
jgi:hypothetical protein